MKIGVELVTGFADEDNASDIEGFDKLVNFGEVLIVGLIATTKDEDDGIVRESLNRDAGRTEVGGKIVVVIFNAV